MIHIRGFGAAVHLLHGIHIYSGNGPTTVANGTRMQTLFDSILYCVASNGLGLPLDAQLAA